MQRIVTITLNPPSMYTMRWSGSSWEGELQFSPDSEHGRQGDQHLRASWLMAWIV